MSTKTKIAAIVVIIMVALLYNAKAQTKILTQKNTKQMQGLKTQMATLETKITDFDKKNTTVSQATVGWQ
jgi:phage shock protein A